MRRTHVGKCADFIPYKQSYLCYINIWLMYSFLTPKRPLWFQIMIFAGTALLHVSLRALLTPLGLDPFLIGYALAVLYLLPAALVFKETIHPYLPLLKTG